MGLFRIPVTTASRTLTFAECHNETEGSLSPEICIDTHLPLFILSAFLSPPPYPKHYHIYLHTSVCPHKDKGRMYGVFVDGGV